MKRVAPGRARQIVEQARLHNREVRLVTHTSCVETFHGFVVAIAQEVGGKNADKIVLDVGTRALVIGFTTLVEVELMPNGGG